MTVSNDGPMLIPITYTFSQREEGRPIIRQELSLCSWLFCVCLFFFFFFFFFFTSWMLLLRFLLAFWL
jgi:hypothetical protein